MRHGSATATPDLPAGRGRGQLHQGRPVARPRAVGGKPRHRGAGEGVWHLRLTDKGEKLSRLGRELLDRLADVETAVRRPSERLTGVLRVGLSVNISRYIIMPGLATFLRRHPGLRLESSIISHPREMHAEGVDVLLRVTDPPASGLIARKVAELRFGVYASPEYLKEAGTPDRPKDLLRHRCFVHWPAPLTRPLDEWIFERPGERTVLKIEPAFSTNDREALIAAVVGGAGIMRIGMFDPALITSGRLRKLLADWACPGGQVVYAMYRRTPRLAPKIAAFLAFAEEAFAAFDPGELTIRHYGTRPARRAAPRGQTRGGPSRR